MGVLRQHKSIEWLARLEVGNSAQFLGSLFLFKKKRLIFFFELMFAWNVFKPALILSILMRVLRQHESIESLANLTVKKTTMDNVDLVWQLKNIANNAETAWTLKKNTNNAEMVWTMRNKLNNAPLAWTLKRNTNNVEILWMLKGKSNNAEITSTLKNNMNNTGIAWTVKNNMNNAKIVWDVKNNAIPTILFFFTRVSKVVTSLLCLWDCLLYAWMRGEIV